jgi:hypothetical protein
VRASIPTSSRGLSKSRWLTFTFFARYYHVGDSYASVVLLIVIEKCTFGGALVGVGVY